MRRRTDFFDPYKQVKRGVYKPNANFPGLIRIEVVDSNGELMFEGSGRAEIMDEAMERGFRRMLAKKDTGLKLRVVS